MSPSGPTNGGPHPRDSSPPDGCSTLITYAPRSPSIWAAWGPASALDRSRTTMSCRGPGKIGLHKGFQGEGVGRSPVRRGGPGPTGTRGSPWIRPGGRSVPGPAPAPTVEEVAYPVPGPPVGGHVLRPLDGVAARPAPHVLLDPLDHRWHR